MPASPDGVTADAVPASSSVAGVPHHDLPSAEDLKLVTLARAARARAGGGAGAQGAAVRDEIGRTYAAAAVSLPSLALTALQAAVAAAVSSGSDSLDAAVVLGGAGLAEADRSLVADLGIGTLWLAAADGTVSGRG